MNVARQTIRAVALWSGISLLAGCGGLFPPPYGQLAEDADPVRADGRPVFMPAHAPSTMNGHWADYDGHPGIDVIGEVGLPVLAAAPGTVSASYLEPMYGHTLFIDHGVDANGHAVQTRYVHLDTRLVEAGDRVRRGQQIGTLGRTGLLASGIPHLHFEVQTRGPGRYQIYETRNPHYYWADGVGVVTCYESGSRIPVEPFRSTYPVPCRGLDWR